MSDGRATDSSSVGDAIDKMREAMRAIGGGTIDPERRRAAALLAELIRSDDGDLDRFAGRHLPGRSVESGAVKELRDLACGIARLVGMQGKDPAASALVATVRSVLFAQLDEIDVRVAAGRHATSRDASTPGDRAMAPASAPVLTTAAAPPSSGRMPSYLRSASVNDRQGATSPPGPPSPTSTPFVTASEGAPTPPPMQVVAAPLTVSESMPRGGSFTIVDEGTAMSDELVCAPDSEAEIRHGGLPFGGAAPAGSSPAWPSPPALTAPAAVAAPAAAPRPLEPLSQTADMPGRAPDGAPAVAPPTSPELPAHLAFIDLDAHAVFTALLAVYPHREDDIFARYGLLDRSERALLDNYWYARFARYPRESGAWVTLRDRYIQHYRGAR